MTNFNNVKIVNSSGFEFINKISNINNNFFIFIDPSYEIKDDFEKIYNFIDNIEIKYERAKILIWYPILSYSENDIFRLDLYWNHGGERSEPKNLDFWLFNPENGSEGHLRILFSEFKDPSFFGHMSKPSDSHAFFDRLWPKNP